MVDVAGYGRGAMLIPDAANGLAAS